MNYRNKIRKALNEGGYSLLLQRVFNVFHSSVRPVLPDKKFRKGKLDFIGKVGDYHNTSETSMTSDVKWEARKAVNRYVGLYDVVICIGTGEGLTPTHCAKQGASVIAYEPAEPMIEKTRETAEVNDVGEKVIVKPAIFHADRETDVWGELHDDTAYLEGSDLNNPVDVLELDCEGAELEILKDIQIRPRVIICEVHEAFGVEYSDVLRELRKMDYVVVEEFPQDVDDGTINMVAKKESAL